MPTLIVTYFFIATAIALAIVIIVAIATAFAINIVDAATVINTIVVTIKIVRSVHHQHNNNTIIIMFKINVNAYEF